MLNFLKKLFLFLLPVALFLVLPIVVVVFGREYVSMRTVVGVQMKYPDTIFGFAYNNESFIPYKKLLVENSNPKVVTIGSSRVMQIRKEFFLNEDDFINAGGISKRLGDVQMFLQELPNDTSIEVLIMGLDQEMFYENPLSYEDRTESMLPIRFIRLVSQMGRRMYLDYVAQKYSLSLLLEDFYGTKNIGLSALVCGDGFRSDGSYRYNESSQNPRRVEQVLLQIDQQAKRITVDQQEMTKEKEGNLEENIKMLSDIFEIAKQKEIRIIGFLPPYPEPTYQAMLSGSGLDREMVTTVPLRVEEIFSEYGHPFFDLSATSVFEGEGDLTEFVDVIHGTDVMYLKMLIYISEHTDKLDQYVDASLLKNMLQDAEGDFLQF